MLCLLYYTHHLNTRHRKTRLRPFVWYSNCTFPYSDPQCMFIIWLSQLKKKLSWRNCDKTWKNPWLTGITSSWSGSRCRYHWGSQGCRCSHCPSSRYPSEVGRRLCSLQPGKKKGLVTWWAQQPTTLNTLGHIFKWTSITTMYTYACYSIVTCK